MHIYFSNHVGIEGWMFFRSLANLLLKYFPWPLHEASTFLATTRDESVYIDK